MEIIQGLTSGNESNTNEFLLSWVLLLLNLADGVVGSKMTHGLWWMPQVLFMSLRLRRVPPRGGDGLASQVFPHSQER